MLRLIPPPLHRIALIAAHEVRKLWWRLARPRVEGVRVVALDDRGQVLLVRHGYGNRNWMTPGGGLRRGEDPLIAAARELREECNCGLNEARLLAVAEENLFGAANTVHIIGGRLDGTPRGDGREVLACALFPADGLPPDLPPRLRGTLPGWISQQA